jgi:hypothetical protein
LGRNLEIGTGALSWDSYVYIVDTHRDWTAAAAMSQSELKRVGDLAAAKPELGQGALDAAAIAIAEASAAAAGPASEAAEHCVFVVCLALSQTQTWQIVLDRMDGSLAGHWIYLTYTTKNGKGPIGRPAYFRHPKPGLLDPEALEEAVRMMVRQDTGPATTSVAKMIAADGGALLAKKFRS